MIRLTELTAPPSDTAHITQRSSLLQLQPPVLSDRQRELIRLAVGRVVSKKWQKENPSMDLSLSFLCMICLHWYSLHGPYLECTACERLHHGDPTIFPRFRICSPECQHRHDLMARTGAIMQLRRQRRVREQQHNKIEVQLSDWVEWVLEDGCVTLGTAHDVSNIDHGDMEERNFPPADALLNQICEPESWPLAVRLQALPQWAPTPATVRAPKHTKSQPPTLGGDREASSQMLLLIGQRTIRELQRKHASRNSSSTKRGRSPNTIASGEQLAQVRLCNTARHSEDRST